MDDPVQHRLRVPSWVAPGTAALWLDGAQRELRWDGTYLALDTVAAGSRVSLRYPLAERVEGFSVNDETTLAYWRGGTVVDVLPDQGPAPIYQRRELPYTPVPDSPGSVPRPYSSGSV